MIIPFKLRILFVFCLTTLIYSCSGNLSQTILFEDNFSRLPAGIISPDEGSFGVYHYLPGLGQAGPWKVTAFNKQPGFENAWEIVHNNDHSFLHHNYFAVDENLNRNHPYMHSMIVAGDSIWHDYKVSFEFSPHQLLDQCGLAFKYKNDRSYYYYGMDGNRLVIKMVKHETAPRRPYEVILASAYFNWEADKIYKGEISIRENKIYALMDGATILVAEDDTYQRGKIGFLSDVPASFYNISVTTLKREKRKISRFQKQLTAQRSRRISENTEPVVWRKIITEGFGSGRSIRFGELNSDGEMDIVIGQVTPSIINNHVTELTCITAVTLEGEVLWQKGEPADEHYRVKGDIPLQVHDLDNDGRREVVYIKDNSIYVVEGRSGKIVRSAKIPVEKIRQHDTVGKIGTSLFFCDLNSSGWDSNIIVIDRFQNLLAYNKQLKLQWMQTFEKGYYPVAEDIDGDEKDEIVIGFAMIDDDGNTLWDNNSMVGDYTNVVGVSDYLMPSDSATKIIYGAGDWGMMMTNASGNTIKQNLVGHVQYLMAANLRQDLPGLELVTVNSWGSQGIVTLFDAHGNKYQSLEMQAIGGNCHPVNWRGDGVEYFLLNANPGDGGLLDGAGKLVVSLPDDGHPDLGATALNLTGDSRDEIVTWNQHEIWIYTQQPNIRDGKVYSPERPPLYNYSLHQCVISSPGWSE